MKTKRCPYCKVPIVDMDMFCKECGRPVQELTKKKGSLASDYQDVYLNIHSKKDGFK